MTDRKGLIQNRLAFNGGINSIAVSKDSSQFWVGSLDGKLVSGVALLFEPLLYKNYKFALKSETSLLISDINSDYSETIELSLVPAHVEVLNDRIMVLLPGKLLLSTIQSPNSFANLDISRESFISAHLNTLGVALLTMSGTVVCQVYDLALKPVGNIKLPLTEINPKRFNFSDNWVAWIDPRAASTISFECVNQKAASSFTHSTEVISICFSPLKTNKKLLLLDVNQDLYLMTVPGNSIKKVASIVTSFKWHENIDIFTFISGGQLNVAYCPTAIFFDAALFKITTHAETLAGNFELQNFYECSITVMKDMRVSGLLSADPITIKLIKLLSDANKTLEIRAMKGLKLARLVKNKFVWGVLAGFCLENRDTSTAEVALAALDLIDRVQFVSKINSEEQADVQNNMLLQMFGKFEDCEKVLTSKRKNLELVKMLIKNFQFSKALEVAKNTKGNELEWLVDYVLFKRKNYIEEGGFKEEFEPAFKGLKPSRAWEEIKELKNKNK